MAVRSGFGRLTKKLVLAIGAILHLGPIRVISAPEW